MPSGKRHEDINISLLGLGLAAYHFQVQPLHTSEPTMLAFSLGYFAGTFLITPDLDLADKKVRAKTNWGWLGWMWVPYGWCFSHRGLSHSWIVGPLTRIIYLLGIAGLVYSLGVVVFGYLGIKVSLAFLLDRQIQSFIWPAVLGYYVSQWLHLVVDALWTFPKSARRKKWGRAAVRASRKSRSA